MSNFIVLKVSDFYLVKNKQYLWDIEPWNSSGEGKINRNRIQLI